MSKLPESFKKVIEFSEAIKKMYNPSYGIPEDKWPKIRITDPWEKTDRYAYNFPVIAWITKEDYEMPLYYTFGDTYPNGEPFEEYMTIDEYDDSGFGIDNDSDLLCIYLTNLMINTFKFLKHPELTDEVVKISNDIWPGYY